MSNGNEAKGIIVDEDAALQDPGTFENEPETQVEEPRVIFVPKKDFTARVNQDDFNFRKDVPTRVDRSVANMLLEDPERGYVRD